MLWLLVGCAAGAPLPDPGFGPHFGKADDASPAGVAGLFEGSPEAAGVLAAANMLDRDGLDVEAGLASDAAGAIVAARTVDGPFLTLQALIDVDDVGPAAVHRLFAYADLTDLIDYGAVPRAPERVVAFGDLHGDVDATREVLRLVGAIDEDDAWVGGELVVVQVGDVLDRGDDEAEIMALVARLEDDARETGGAFVMLLGNHELMNAGGDFRYVTEAGFTTFGDPPGDGYESFALGERARAAAFLPGGRAARWLARHDVVAKVGDTLYAHAGVLPHHVDYGLDLINHEARTFLLFEGGEVPPLLDADDGPVWFRGYGNDEDTDCVLVAETLALTDTARMVIGHTVQADGISTACDGTLHRIDVGMSAHYGGGIEALEIVGGEAYVLSLW